MEVKMGCWCISALMKGALPVGVENVCHLPSLIGLQQRRVMGLFLASVSRKSKLGGRE